MEFEEIWSKFSQKLRGFIAKKVSDPHITDELSQILLIKVYQNIDSLNDRERIEGWLYRIARNVINDYYRKKKQDETNQFSDIENYVDLLDNKDSSQSIYEDLICCIEPFIKQLPEKYRRTLTAVDLDGSSQKALADKLGVSHSTIKSQTQRGRTLLKQQFKRCCDFSLDRQGNLVSCDQTTNKCQSQANCTADNSTT